MNITRVENPTLVSLRQEGEVVSSDQEKKSGVVSYIAGICMGILGAAAAGASTLSGYTGIKYLYSYLNPPEDYEEYVQKKGAAWMIFSTESPSEYQRAKAGHLNKIQCAIAGQGLTSGFKAREHVQNLVAEFRQHLEYPNYLKIEDYKREEISKFLKAYDEGKSYNCNPIYLSGASESVSLQERNFCAEMNNAQEVVVSAPSLGNLAQEAWNQREGLSHCLELNPLNGITAGVLLTASLVAAFASYKLLKRAFAY